MKVEQRINVPFEKKLPVIDKYLDQRRKAQELLNPYKAETSIDINSKTDLPFKTVHVGDTHLGHDHSDKMALRQAIAQTGQNGVLVTHGNVIDSVSGKFIRNNTTRIALDLDEQEAIARGMLSGIASENRLIAMGGNFCHEGWAEKTATHDPTRAIVGETTPLLYNGGQIKLRQSRKVVGNIEVYHNSGKGRTKQSPEGSVRERSREIPFGHPDKPTVIVDGHMHQLVAAQDVAHDPSSDKDFVTTLGQVGAAKGTKENPDTFLTGLGVPPRLQPGDVGPGLVVIWDKGREGKIKPYPVAGYSRAELLFRAQEVWERTQKSRNFKELKEIILDEHKDHLPKKTLIESKSKARIKDEACKSEGVAPLYKRLAYEITDTDLPVKLQFIGGLRVGSASLERDLVKQILQEAEANPWSYVFATRRLLNQGTSGSFYRARTLENLVDLLSLSKNSLMGIMLTDEMKIATWSKEIKVKGEGTAQPLLPGDWLYYESKLKGIPLMLPETFMDLKVGNVPYKILMRDKLQHFTSLINPFHGLERIQEIFGNDADISVGGHTEVVGWRTWVRSFGQRDIIVPGGFSEYVEKGIGNRVDSVKGGQGVILLPDQKTFYSFATHEDGVDIHDALLLYQGLKKNGLLEKIN